MPGIVDARQPKGNQMDHTIIPIHQKKRIALVAHDNKKQELLDWADWNKELLIKHELYATGTTGKLLEEVLGVPVIKYQSGPLGGDQQIGAKIAEGVIDFMIFFWDPLTQQPHDTDVKALLRIAVVWNIPVACNRASADFMISSVLMTGEYKRLVANYDPYRERQVEALVSEIKTDEQESDSTPVATSDNDPSTGTAGT
ncbi:MAG TPA: methylglyoxal synthase [Anaerolineaceae bacterium]|nr:methylglyoxal synthase [Anaerolineaceae bacterium]